MRFFFTLVEIHKEKLKQPSKVISSELMEIFKRRRWEGNIREMENIIIQGLLFSTDDVIRPADVGLKTSTAQIAPWESVIMGLPYKAAKEKILKKFNDRYLGHMLSTHKGNITHAANASGMERQALQQIIRRYRIDADRYRN